MTGSPPSSGNGVVTTSNVRRWWRLLRDPYLWMVVIAGLGHTVAHYAALVPAFRRILFAVPYLNLHDLHQAEYIGIIALAAYRFRLRGGLIILLATAIASVPYILTPLLMGREPRPNELRDRSIEIIVTLIIGGVVVAFSELLARQKVRAQLSSHRLALLHRLSSDLASSLNRDTTLQTTLDTGCRNFAPCAGAIYLNEEDSGAYLLALQQGMDQEACQTRTALYQLDDVERLSGEGQTSPVIPLPLLPPAYASLADIVPSHLSENAVLVPLVAGEKQVGFLLLATTRPLDTQEQKLLAGMAHTAALALENSRLYQIEKYRAEELDWLDRAKSEFLFTVAHQLKTHLTPLRGALDVMSTSTGKPGLFSDQALDIARRSEQQLEQEVEHLLSFFQLKQQQVTLNIEPSSLPEVVTAAVEGVRPHLSARKESIVVDIPRSLPPVNMDPERIQAALVCLLQNAAGYTPPGGKVILSAQAMNGAVLVKVRDTGPGLKEEERRRLFTEYYQGGDRGGRRGTELGVAIAKSIVDLHGGRIWVEGSQEEGNIFCFTLPLAGPSAPPATPPSQS